MLWDDLRFFLAVQRKGSHKGAARVLSVDPTTVGRRIAALEAALETPLFVRTPERLELTASGRALQQRAERVENELVACERELKALDPAVEGPLRVTATDGFIRYLVLPALAELRRAHPGLVLDLRADTRTFDLSRREADVAVRLTRPREQSLVARRVGNMPFGLFASAEYLERKGTPRQPSALAQHEFVGFDLSLDQVFQVKWLTQQVAEPRYALRANNTYTVAAACAAGHGIALLPLFVALHEPKLQRLFPRVPGPSRELWAVTHSDLKTNPRVVICMNFLAQVAQGAGGFA